MVVHHAGRCSNFAQHGTETPPQGNDTFHAKDGEGTSSALRALLLLSGAVSSTDNALKRTTDADIATTTKILALLATSKPATHAA